MPVRGGSMSRAAGVGDAPGRLTATPPPSRCQRTYGHAGTHGALTAAWDLRSVRGHHSRQGTRRVVVVDKVGCALRLGGSCLCRQPLAPYFGNWWPFNMREVRQSTAPHRAPGAPALGVVSRCARGHSLDPGAQASKTLLPETAHSRKAAAPPPPSYRGRTADIPSASP